MSDVNRTLLQYFHWDYPDDGSLWRRISEESPALTRLGITALWLPPPTKASERANAGYALYDLWDLGEFNQKGSIRTKYGTRAELVEAITAAHQSGLELYLDVVFNHKAGADGTERVRGLPVNANNRNLVDGPEQDIDAWTLFRFDGRGGCYSTMQWNHSHFDSVDYDNLTRTQRIFRICNRNFEPVVSRDLGNYDFLMFADTDTTSEEVRKEFISWGEWMVDSIGFDGFRIDAAKHIGTDLFAGWFRALDARFTGRSLFAVGEYFDEELAELTGYLDALGGRMSLFDFPLFFKLRAASQQGAVFDMRSLFADTLAATRPNLAVTFVDNHDIARENPVVDWFKPLAYSTILLRAEGYPCVFYLDLYGRSGQAPHSEVLERLIAARRDYAYGLQRDYCDDRTIVGWTRLGDEEHPRAMAVILSSGDGGTKRMDVKRPNASFSDVTGNIGERIETEGSGMGVFRCKGGSVSVWVEDDPSQSEREPRAPATRAPIDAQGGALRAVGEASGGLTVHFKRPADWTPGVRVHYWGTRPQERQTAWPGEAMAAQDGDWYRLQLPGVISAKLVFNDGSGHQTGDLARERDGWYYRDRWYDADPEERAPDVRVRPRGGAYAAAIDVAVESTYERDFELFYTFDDPSSEAARWQRYRKPVRVENSSTLAIRAATARGQLGLVRLFHYEIGVDQDTSSLTMAASHERKSYCNCVSEPTALPDFRDETIYFVITTRFCEGDPSTSFYCRDRIQFEHGTPVDPHWRGDFKGLIAQLDYIRELGFSAIWITPPVENRSGLDYHGYHAYDWTKIDPRLESRGASYADLIREVHARGMKIIQDVVVNHSSQYGIRNRVWIDHLPIKYYVPQGSQQGKVNLGPYQGNLGNYAHPYREDNDNPLAPDWFRARQNADAEGCDPLVDPVTCATVPQPGYNPGRFFGVDARTLDKSWYHQEGFIAGGDWENPRPLEQTHMAGDCIDLNTESLTVKAYIMEAIDRYLDMGVDALRIDTVKHIERDNLLEYVNHWKARKPSVFVFGEVMVKGTGWGDLFGDDNGPSAIRPWWYTRLGSDPRNPNSGADSGLAVLDFSLFSTFRDNIANGNFSGIGGILERDYVYGDASRLVTFFQNHDVGPDNDFRYRFRGEDWKAALAYNLLWTIRGIPCLYYGEEVAFMRGAPQDVIGNDDTLSSTGRAYFGDYLLPSRLATTKGHVLFRHIQRLNQIRQRIPALRKGVMTNVSEWGGGMRFVRDLAAEGSYALVGLAAGGNGQDITFNGVENGNYVDAITGNSVTVANGTLGFHVQPVSMGVYVKDGPGKIGEDLEFLR